MSLRNIDIDSALRRLAERRIEEAMRDGKFDNLAGMGKPLDLEPMPANEDARLAWWTLRVLKNNDFTPDEIVWRKQVDRLRDEIHSATTEKRIVALVMTHNGLVKQINTLGTNALKTSVTPLSIDHELRKLHERSAGVRVCSASGCGCENPISAQYCRRCGAGLG